MYRLLAALWIGANAVFWFWWLQPERVGATWSYVLLTCAWAYEATLLPSMYLGFVKRMRHPRHIRALPGLRVALITLCVPTQETLAVIERQLEALIGVHYPHDSWVLDECNDAAVRFAAERLGVRHFSRCGVKRYNQPIAPFKARTKAGNVNAWLDQHGDNYSIFVQFDIDHLPRPDYLNWVLGYFRDDQVGWVQAPSLYGNLSNWVARGAAEQELVLQGPLQRGFFGHSSTPFIIGSHCSYRTSAIREIGGFAPTRAEDHLDTALLASRGYRGVFVPEAIALGGGPETFETYLRQQFAWALSMMQVLVSFTPRMLGSLSPHQCLQFLFAQTWYPIWSTSMLVLFLTPLLALLTGQEPARAPLWQFGLASAPQVLAAYLIWRWTRRWHLPHGLGLSWRGVVLHVARWPIVFWALLNVVLGVRHPYMITPKGERLGIATFPLRTQAIYLFGAVLGMGAVWQYVLREGSDAVEGYTLFALLGVAYMLGVVVTNLGADLIGLRLSGIDLGRVLRLRLSALLTVCVALIGLAGTVGATRDGLVVAATWTGQPPELGVPPGAMAARQVLEESGRQPRTPATDLVRQYTRTLGLLSPDPRFNPPALALLDDPRGPVLAGAYDPWQDARSVALGMEHWYVRQDEPGLLADALDHADQRVPLVTIEPFPRRSAPVLERISGGDDDRQLHELARTVRERQPQVALLRWGQEMDLAGLYPWATSDPELYRAAFRHVVSVFRSDGATNARWVWSPAGEADAVAFYPGDDVVDYVGLTVLGDPEWDWDLGYTTRRSMVDLLRPRYLVVAPLDKPVIIAELGTSGDSDQQRAWLEAGVAGLGEFDRVRALVYFEDRNAPNNHRLTQPNWRLAPDVLAKFAADVSGT